MKTHNNDSEQKSVPDYLNQSADRIIRNITINKKYTSILGPRYSGKTELIDYVIDQIKDRNILCICINFIGIQAFSQEIFFTYLTHAIINKVHDETGRKVLFGDNPPTSEDQFHSFLRECIKILQRDLVLILDHIESAPQDLIRSLLKSLRSVFNDQENWKNKYIVIIVGSLSVGNITSGPTSPFYMISDLVIIDLPLESESRKYLTDYQRKIGVHIPEDVSDVIIPAAEGDYALLQKISNKIKEVNLNDPIKSVTIKHVRSLIMDFINNEAGEHTPLIDAIRQIEINPDLLTGIHELIRKGRVNKNKLRIPLSPDIDPFFATGVVKLDEQNNYYFRNDIYKKYLTKYFHPGKIGRLLSMSGYWKTAVDILKSSVKRDDQEYLPDLLSGAVNSIYTSKTIREAVGYLHSGLMGFSIYECRVWIAQPNKRILGLELDTFTDKQKINEISVLGKELEARAYQDACLLRGADVNGMVEWAIPLSYSEKAPLGAIFFRRQLFEKDAVEQRDWEITLNGFINQASRALHEVDLRLQWTKQIEAVNQIALNIAEQREVQNILQEAIIKAVELLHAAGGSIYIWNEQKKVFTLKTLYGFDKELLNTDFPSNRGVLGEIYKTSGPCSVNDYHRWDFRQKAFDKYQITAVVGAPIKSGARLKGAIVVHDEHIERKFNREDEDLLLRVANFIAALFENATVSQFYNSLISSSSDGIIAFDNHGWVTLYNKAAERICIYTQDEVLQGKMQARHFFKGKKAVETIINKIESTGEINDEEIEIINKNKNPIPIMLSASVLKDNWGKINGIVCYIKDLRKLKQAEKDLKTALDVLWIAAKSNNFESGLRRISKKMVVGLDVSFCLFLLSDKGLNKIRLIAASSVRRHRSLVWNPPFGENINLKNLPIIEWLSRMRSSKVYLKDASVEERKLMAFVQEMMGLSEPLQAISVILMESKSNIQCVCVLGENRSTRAEFNDDKQRKAERLIDAVALMIDRFNSQNLMEQRVILSEELRKVGDAVTRQSSTDLLSVLNKTATSICKVTRADCAMIYPYFSHLGIHDIHNIGSYGLLKDEKVISTKLRRSEKSMNYVVLQKREPIRVDDVGRKSDRTGKVQIWSVKNDFLDRQKIISFVGFPLISGGEEIGTLFINFRKFHRISSDEEKIVSLFANHAISAIKQNRQHLRAEKDHKTVTAANEITKLIGKEQPSEKVWTAILQGAINVTSAERGKILLRDPFGHVEPGIQIGFQENTNRRENKKSSETCMVMKKVLDTKESLFIPDTTDDPVNQDLCRSCLEHCPEIRSLLAVPILLADINNPIGALILESSKRAAFGEYDSESLGTFVKYAGVAIVSARRIQEIENGNKLRQNLMELSNDLTSLVRFEQVFDDIPDSARNAFDCDVVTLYTYNQQTNEFSFPPKHSGTFKNIDALYELGRVSDKSVVWHILQNGDSVFEQDTQNNALFLSDTPSGYKGVLPFAIREEIKSSAGIPLKIGNEKVGILFINYREHHQFTREERKNIDLFSSQAAIAIHNARIYKKLVQSESLNKISNIVGRNQNELMEKSLDLAMKICSASGPEASFGTIQILDDRTNELVFSHFYPKASYEETIVKIGKRIVLDKANAPQGKIGITGLAARDRRAYLIYDVREDLFKQDYLDYSHGTTRSELAVPILDEEDGRVFGVIDIESKSVRAFDTSDRDAIILLAQNLMSKIKTIDKIQKFGRMSAVAAVGAWSSEVLHTINTKISEIRTDAFLLGRDYGLSPEAIIKINNIEGFFKELDNLPKDIPMPGETYSGIGTQIDLILEKEVEKWKRNYPDIDFRFKGNCNNYFVAAPPEWITHFISHLLKNSIEATEKKDSRHIGIGTKKIFDEIEIIVDDNGTGIPESVCEKLFKEPILNEKEGRGTGLFVIGYVIELFGGKTGIIKMEKEEEGATLFFTIPIHEDQNELAVEN